MGGNLSDVLGTREKKKRIKKKHTRISKGNIVPLLHCWTCLNACTVSALHVNMKCKCVMSCSAKIAVGV